MDDAVSTHEKTSAKAAGPSSAVSARKAKRRAPIDAAERQKLADRVAAENNEDGREEARIAARNAHLDTQEAHYGDDVAPPSVPSVEPLTEEDAERHLAALFTAGSYVYAVVQARNGVAVKLDDVVRDVERTAKDATPELMKISFLGRFIRPLGVAAKVLNALLGTYARGQQRAVAEAAGGK